MRKIIYHTKKLITMMKYLIVPALLLMPFTAGAATTTLNLGTNLNSVGSTGYGTSAPTDLLTIVGTIINVALGFLGVIFLLLTVYAGFLWMTAQGNEEQTTKAKGILTTAVIGLIITLAAYSIASFVVNQVTNATNVG